MRNDKPIFEEELIEKNGLTPTDEESTGSRTPKTGKAFNSRYVQVRKVPSSNAPVVETMKLGDQAEILEKLPGFYKIKIGNHIGFVASNYFKED